MNRSKLFLASVLVVGLCAAGAVSAQEAEQASGASVRPMELYGCQFRDGKGWSELEQVTAKWNAWMDAQGANDYWALQLVPVYHSAELKADVLWAGGWQDGATMGAGMERWMKEGGELRAEFDRVVDCAAIWNFAVLGLQPPRDSAVDGPVQFSNCKVEEGREFPEAMAAVQAWIAFEAEHGVEARHYMLFPAMGELPDADYDFKWVTGMTWTQFGASYDLYGNGGGWQKAGELFEGLLDCDSSRLYQSMRVRAIKMEE